MSVLAGCHDVRNMTSIKEVECPACKAGIEVFVRDGHTVGDSVCEKCGYTILDGLHLEEYRIL